MRFKPSGYYEAILQLRKANEKVLDFIEESLESEKHKGVFISDERKTGEGVDYYVSSRRYCQALGKKLLQAFGGTLKINHRLYGVKNGREVYRTTVYFEPPEFSAGDVIRFGSRIVRIKQVGKFVSGTDVVTWKRVSEEAKRVKPEILTVYKTTVTKHFPQLEVLNPETYESSVVENPKNVKEKVEVVISEGRIYLV